MGYTKHDAVIVTMLDPSEQTKTVIEQFRQSMPENFQQLLVGPIHAPTNGYVTYALLPDGSKEHWTNSDVGDDLRAQFIALLGRRAYLADIVQVSYGADHETDHDGPTVVAHYPDGKG